VLTLVLSYCFLEQIHAYLQDFIREFSRCPLDMYATALAQPSVLELVRNPFVLKLFAEALPAMSPAEREIPTRYSIYSVFSRQWFIREVERLPAPDRVDLGLLGKRGVGHGLVTMDELLQRFDLLSSILAGLMFKVNTLRIEYTADEDFVDGDVWRQYEDMANSWLVSAVKARAHPGADSVARRTVSFRETASIAALPPVRQ
jgi:hypothetical protein